MNPRILAARRQLFLRRTKEITLRNQTLYHGSPTEGLAEIHRSRMIYPQEHGILPGKWFCVSPNDNMLRCFSDGESPNGMVFETPTLRCLQLDWMHMALSSYESSADFTEDWLEKHPEDEALARRLGYSQHRGELGMSENDFRALIPEWVDGVIFPWTCYQQDQLWPGGWNDECEVALNEQGCQKIWKSLGQLVIRGEWEENVKRGWRKILRNERKLAA